MKALARQALWQKLQAGGLVEGNLPRGNEIDSPWYIRVMLGFAGWIGSLFLLGFVGAGFAFVMKSALAALVVGVCISGGAFALFRFKRETDFITQFSLAVGLAGQMLLIFGLSKLFDGQDSTLFGAAFVVEVILTVLMPNFIYRVMSSMAAMLALSLSLNSLGVFGIATAVTAAAFAWIWLQETRLVKFSALYRPVGYGLALSLLLYRVNILWGRGLWWHRSRHAVNWIEIYSPWLSLALVAVTFFAVVFILLKRMDIAAASRTGSTVFAGATLVMAASVVAPGIAPALLVLIVGFAVCSRVMIGLGLLAMGGFLSNYYYMMQSTLLTKSMLLFGLGALLLVSRLLINRFWPSRFFPPIGGGQVDA